MVSRTEKHKTLFQVSTKWSIPEYEMEVVRHDGESGTGQEEKLVKGKKKKTSSGRTTMSPPHPPPGNEEEADEAIPTSTPFLCATEWGWV